MFISRSSFANTAGFGSLDMLDGTSDTIEAISKGPISDSEPGGVVLKKMLFDRDVQDAALSGSACCRGFVALKS